VFTESEVPFGQRKVQHRQNPYLFAQWGGGHGYGVRHHLDQVPVAPLVEITQETVAPIVLPTDEIHGVYGRRLPGRIAVAESTVIAVDRKARSLRRIRVLGLTVLGHAHFPFLGLARSCHFTNPIRARLLLNP
jgi:hypothetical protein